MKSLLNPDNPLTLRRISMISHHLREEALSAQELGSAIHAAQGTVSRYIRYLRDTKQIHIGRWERDGYHIVALYTWGPGRDKVRPPRLSRTEHNKRYWRNLNDDIIRKEAYLQKRRAPKLKPRRDWAIEALYGVAA